MHHEAPSEAYVAADMTMSGIELPRGSTVTYAFQQTRFESKWQLPEFSDLFCLAQTLI